jgi:hypothetical protein
MSRASVTPPAQHVCPCREVSLCGDTIRLAAPGLDLHCLVAERSQVVWRRAHVQLATLASRQRLLPLGRRPDHQHGVIEAAVGGRHPTRVLSRALPGVGRAQPGGRAPLETTVRRLVEDHRGGPVHQRLRPRRTAVHAGRRQYPVQGLRQCHCLKLVDHRNAVGETRGGSVVDVVIVDEAHHGVVCPGRRRGPRRAARLLRGRVTSIAERAEPAAARRHAIRLG